MRRMLNVALLSLTLGSAADVLAQPPLPPPPLPHPARVVRDVDRTVRHVVPVRRRVRARRHHANRGRHRALGHRRTLRLPVPPIPR